MSFCFSSICRKSAYLAAFVYASPSCTFCGVGGPSRGLRRACSDRSTYGKSTSHTATMFSLSICDMLLMPMPPIPTQAMLSLSLGAR